MGTGLGKERDWGGPAKGPKGREGWQGGAGEGRGGSANGGKGTRAAAVAAQAHLGERGEGRGVSRRLTRGGEDRSRDRRGRSAAGFASPLTSPRAEPATTCGPAPTLSANSQRLPRTEVQKPFRLETGCLIGSREPWAGAGVGARTSPRLRRKASNGANRRPAPAGQWRAGLADAGVGGLGATGKLRLLRSTTSWLLGCKARCASAPSVSSQHPYRGSALPVY